VERGRDREGGIGRKIQAGGGEGGDTGDLASARISTEVYATSRLQRRGALGPEECRFGEVRESWSEQSARPRGAVPDEGKLV
jgi:hypothetical protein